MGKNKMENFIFTMICCFLMVFGMSFYNSVLKTGFNSSFVLRILITFIPVFFIALIIDWFLVGPIAKKLVKKLVNENTSFIKKILLISLFMVTGMSICMSLIATIIEFGLNSDFLLIFIKTELRNIAFALPLQLALVGPLARFVFLKVFPPEKNIIQNA